MFKANVMYTWKILNQSFMPHNLLWTLTKFQVAAKQPQQSNLVTELHVPVWEGQIPDPDPSEAMTGFSWTSEAGQRTQRSRHLINLFTSTLSFMSPNVGEVPRVRAVQGAVLVFWDTKLENLPVQDNLNTVHTVSNVRPRPGMFINKFVLQLLLCTLAGNVLKQHLLQC